MKPFKEYENQIKILRSRKLIINNEEKAIKILKNLNYYNIVNGYKRPFLKKDLNGDLSDPEEFIDGCTFEELISLYYLDKELKSELFSYLLEFERKLKSYTAYLFSEKYKEEKFPYLNINNYSREKEDLTKVLSIVKTISDELKNKKAESVAHYINNYNDLPLWVLINQLTLGNVSYFYDAIDITLREKIAKNFSLNYKKDYNSKESITSEILINIIKIVIFFRNICAHDNILLLFRMKSKTKTSEIKKVLTLKDGEDKIKNNIDYRGENLYDLLCVLKLVLDKENFKLLITKIKDILSKYEKKFSVTTLENIIALGGIKKNYLEELLK